MAKGKRIPRFRRGSKIYRVEWNKQKPFVVEYEVETGSVLSIVVKDNKGREHIVVGKEMLQQFADTPQIAVAADFERICTDVIKHGSDTVGCLKSVVQLGDLI